MPMYIVLANWTDQGIRAVKESPNRLETARKLLREAGGEIREAYLTMGDYDLVFVVEAPDDSTMAKLLLATGAAGSVRTKTLKAFSEAEYGPIIRGLPG